MLGSSLVNRRQLYDIMRAPDGRCTSRAVCPIPLTPEPVVAHQITITTEGLPQPRYNYSNRCPCNIYTCGSLCEYILWDKKASHWAQKDLFTDPAVTC